MTELTIKWPDPLLEEARKAAKAMGQGLESYLLQAALERIQRQNAKPGLKIKDWPKERLRSDWAWIESHYQSLVETYPNQWIYVHNQQVCGANRDMAKAEEQAERVLGNIGLAVPVAFFVPVGHYVL